MGGDQQVITDHASRYSASRGVGYRVRLPSCLEQVRRSWCASNRNALFPRRFDDGWTKFQFSNDVCCFTADSKPAAGRWQQGLDELETRSNASVARKVEILRQLSSGRDDAHACAVRRILHVDLNRLRKICLMFNGIEDELIQDQT